MAWDMLKQCMDSSPYLGRQHMKAVCAELLEDYGRKQAIAVAWQMLEQCRGLGRQHRTVMHHAQQAASMPCMGHAGDEARQGHPFAAQ